MCDINSHDLDNILSWFSDETKVWIPPASIVSGLRRIRVLFKLIFKRYDILNFEILCINELVGDEQKVFVEMCSWGKFRNGESYSNHIVSALKFDKSGKIISLSDFFKDTTQFST